MFPAETTDLKYCEKIIYSYEYTEIKNQLKNVNIRAKVTAMLDPSQGVQCMGIQLHREKLGKLTEVYKIL